MMKQLELHLSIGMLHAAYGAAIDEDRLEAWPEFFTPDCQYTITSWENHQRGYAAGIVYCDNQGMLKDRVSGLREANIYEQHRYRHMVSMPSSVDAAGDRVRARTAFAVYRITRGRPSELFVTGCYHDELLVEGDGALRIASRIVVCDSSVFDTLLAIPL